MAKTMLAVGLAAATLLVFVVVMAMVGAWATCLTLRNGARRG